VNLKCSYAFLIVGVLLNILGENQIDIRVLINKSSSSLCNVSAGVPQGSVLGPLLFKMYINDIAEKLISLSRLFADDTSFSYSNRDELQIKTVIDHDSTIIP
jgi:hypothetical protein